MLIVNKHYAILQILLSGREGHEGVRFVEVSMYVI